MNKYRTKKGKGPGKGPGKGGGDGTKFILTTGDASDFDGFMALPLYYKAALENDYDVIFVMNYPSFLNPENDVIIAAKEVYEKRDKNDVGIGKPGLGYNYKYNAIMEATALKIKAKVFLDLQIRKKEINDVSFYINGDPLDDGLKELGVVAAVAGNDVTSEEYKKSIDNITIDIIREYWKWCNDTIKSANKKSPNIYYIKSEAYNSFNPFSSAIVKIEPAVYGGVLKNNTKKVEKVENVMEKGIDFIKPLLTKEGIEIIMDMNGSMAWFSLLGPKEQVGFCEKVTKCFVMGGVMDNSVVNTMSSLPGLLNRFSSATMNQLYHHTATDMFFKKIQGDKLVFITNNEINASFSWGTQIAVDDPIDHGYPLFIEAMRERKLIPEADTIIFKLFDAFYASRSLDRKPFDVISALYLCDYINNKGIKTYPKGDLHFNNKYGCTILTKHEVAITYDFIKNTKKNPNADFIGPGIKAEIEVYDSLDNDTLKNDFFSKNTNINIATIKKINQTEPYTDIIFKDYFNTNKLELVIDATTYPVYEIPVKIPNELPKLGGKHKHRHINVEKVGKVGKKPAKTSKNTHIRKETILGYERSIYKITGKGNKLFVDIKGVPKPYTEVKKYEQEKKK